METIIISSAPGHFAINGTKYYSNPVKVKPLNGTVSIISIADNSVIARGPYTQFRNGNAANAEFDTEAELLTFFDTVFNIGGGDGSGVTVQNLGNISGLVAINLRLGTLIKATLTASVTLSFTGLPAANREIGFILRFSGIEEIGPAIPKADGWQDPYGTDYYEILGSINSSGQVVFFGNLNYMLP